MTKARSLSAPGQGRPTLAQARAALDDLVHSPVRLTLMSALASVDSADYQTLREEMGLSYALLTKHATILEDAGYLAVSKAFEGKTPRTTYRLTRRGRAAYQSHLAALDRIVEGLRRS